MKTSIKASQIDNETNLSSTFGKAPALKVTNFGHNKQKARIDKKAKRMMRLSVDNKLVFSRANQSQLEMLPSLTTQDKFSFFQLPKDQAHKNIANMGSRYRFNRMRVGGWG